MKEKPDVTEQLIKTTVRIINNSKDNKSYVGTGFFFSYNPDPSWNGRIEAIITNKHVTKNSKSLKLTFRTKSNSHSDTENDSIRNFILENPEKSIYSHPDPKVDLCIIFLKPLTKHFREKYDETLDIHYFDKDLIPTDNKISKLKSIEEVLMIGYPKGIIEPKKLYPIVRKGITATPLQTNFNEKEEFLVDIFAIGGSSGSPIVLYRNYNIQPYLLGIHYAGLDNNNSNLGLNIKAKRIIEIFDSFINDRLKSPKEQKWLEEFKKK